MIDRSGGVMGKYDKHRFFTARVLEIRASLFLTLSGAIFVSKIWPFSEAHKLFKIKRAKFIFMIKVFGFAMSKRVLIARK